MIDSRASAQKKLDPRTRRKINTFTILFMAVLFGIVVFVTFVATQQETSFSDGSVVTQGSIIGTGSIYCRHNKYGHYIIVEYTTDTGATETKQIDDCDVPSPYISADAAVTSRAVPIRYMPDDPTQAELDGMSTSKVSLYQWLGIASAIFSVLLFTWGIVRLFRHRKSEILAESMWH